MVVYFKLFPLLLGKTCDRAGVSAQTLEYLSNSTHLSRSGVFNLFSQPNPFELNYLLEVPLRF